MKKILVTGATGYIGGLLIPELLSRGYQVRCMVRDKKKIKDKRWFTSVDVVVANVFDEDLKSKVMIGIDAAYYLIHSMATSKNFHEQDLRAARHFTQSAAGAGVKHLIYLGGLGNTDTDLSDHLRSRQDTGNALRESIVPLTEFRAAVIVGSGSISFEMIRYLTERVPIMICPSWVYTKTQPIAVKDVIDYLVSALDCKECHNQIIEIGGADVITYREMMLGYAKVRGLKRFMIPVPVLTPRLSSYWVHLVTPISGSIAQPLIDGLKNEVIVINNLAPKIFPHIKPLGYVKSLEAALSRLQGRRMDTMDEAPNTPDIRIPFSIETEEGMIVEKRQIQVKASPEAIYHIYTSLGGRRGWLYMDWVWQIRGFFDKIIGGVGMRKSQGNRTIIQPGDIIDFWYVEAVKPNKFLRLRAEMKLPGEAWLQFETYPKKNNYSTLLQSVYFAPKGLSGFLYWYLLYPIHYFLFAGLLRKIAQHSEK